MVMIEEKVPTGKHQSANGKSLGLLIRVVLIASAFGMMIFASQYFRQVVDLAAFEHFVRQAGPWAPLVYMGIYLIGPTLFLPASLLTMAGGIMFGPIWGTCYTIFSATMGATVPFLITRHLGRKPMEKLISRWDNFEEQFRTFERDVEEQGWKYVAFTRLVTIFPFLVLNYAFGLTNIRLWTYMWASFVFMLPGSFMFTYIGYAGKEALAGGEGIATKVSIGIGCFILLSALPSLIKRLKKNGQER